MSETVEQAGDRARFAAREFVARWHRETGEIPSEILTDRMLFAYEMGYMRGHGEGLQAAGLLFDESLEKTKKEGT